MRGKESSDGFFLMNSGITPAYAGKSSAMSRIKSLYWDHPRLCGEKYGYYTIEVSFLGSPPPMRGKVKKEIKKIQEQRITPAYAGKSFRRLSDLFSVQDHPRLCGEKKVQTAFS